LADEALEQLFEAGFDDGTFGEQGGLQYVSLHRSGSSFAATVMQAIRDLERALPGLRVVSIDGDELVTASEIAARIHRTRESIRLLITGDRGPGDFPPAIPWVSAGKTRLYEWAEVVEWLKRHGEKKIAETRSSFFVAALNGALSVRYRATQLADRSERDAVAEIVREDADLLSTHR
jgi:hypothetical protein